MIYLDTSAFLKVLWAEAHSDDLRSYLEAASRPRVSSVLIVIETRRAVLRHDPSAAARADLALSRVAHVRMGPSIVEAASRLPDPGLRTLHAIHLATALLLREEISALVTYDERLGTAAEAAGFAVVAPGRP